MRQTAVEGDAKPREADLYKLSMRTPMRGLSRHMDNTDETLYAFFIVLFWWEGTLSLLLSEHALALSCSGNITLWVQNRRSG
jgi:hypothetical protein